MEGGHRVMFDNKKQFYCCYFAPTNIGKYKITIYAKRGNSDEGKYNEALNLILDVKQTVKNPISFPKTWKNFFDFTSNVISPKNTHLIEVCNGKTHTEILIRTPNDVELLGQLIDANGEKIESEHQAFYDRHKDLWRCQFTPSRNSTFKAEILAKKKSGTGHSTSAVSFKIEAKQIPMPPLSYPKIWQLFHDLNLKIEAPRDRATAVWPENATFVCTSTYRTTQICYLCSTSI
jgi:hypothetical protein